MSAQVLFDEAFAGPRDARSADYKAGVLALLRYRMMEVEAFQKPAALAGSAEFDAYYAGVDEGWNIVRRNDQTLPTPAENSTDTTP